LFFPFFRIEPAQLEQAQKGGELTESEFFCADLTSGRICFSLVPAARHSQYAIVHTDELRPNTEFPDPFLLLLFTENLA